MSSLDRKDWQVQVLHNYTAGHNKFYIVRIDYVGGATPYKVIGSWGAVANLGIAGEKPYGCYMSLADAVAKLNDICFAKCKEGYVNIEVPSYNECLALTNQLKRIDTSRTVGIGVELDPPVTLSNMAQPKTVKNASIPSTPAPPPKKFKAKPNLDKAVADITAMHGQPLPPLPASKPTPPKHTDGRAHRSINI